jgi:cytochrome c oxidase subunit IV
MNEAHANEGHASVGHVVPMPILVGVFASLLVLTVITVAVTYVDLGSINLLVAMGVATVKASLVALFFMHLRWDRPFNAVVFVTALLFLALFITFTLLDSRQYQPDMIPDHAPALERR